MQKKREEEKGEEASLTLLPSNMMTTSFWAYSWISVNQAFKEKKSTKDTEEGERKKMKTKKKKKEKEDEELVLKAAAASEDRIFRFLPNLLPLSWAVIPRSIMVGWSPSPPPPPNTFIAFHYPNRQLCSQARDNITSCHFQKREF